MNNTLSFSYAVFLSDVAKETDNQKRGRRLQGFARLLVTRAQTHLLPDIEKAYTTIVKHSGKHARVIAQTAKPLSPNDIAALKDATEKTLDAALDFQIEVNPSLIGGARMLINDRLVDFSYHAQLQQLHSRLTKKL